MAAKSPSDSRLHVKPGHSALGRRSPAPVAQDSSAQALASPARPARPADRGVRHHARALALQGLYGWLLAGGEADAIAAQLLTEEQSAKVDVAFFRQILGGTIGAAEELRQEFCGLVDRPVAALSPVEHAILLLGAYELKYRPEVPYRVAINEAIELAKSFGGTDGFRYVNGVLDKLAARLRRVEAQAAFSATGGAVNGGTNSGIEPQP